MGRNNQIVIALFCILAILPVIDYLTDQSYDRISGGGNPGIVPIFILVIPTIWFAVRFVSFIKEQSFDMGALIVSLPPAAIYNIWGFKQIPKRLEHIAYDFLRTFERGDWGSSLDGLTFYTNNVYFNPTTFMMFLTWLILIGMAWSIIEKNRDGTKL